MILRSLLALILVSCMAGCLTTENSNSDDASQFGDSGGTPEFKTAQKILADNCASCHADYVSMTEDELIASGAIVPAQPESSPLYYRLIGSSGTLGPKNMPSGGTLGADEIEAIALWIQVAN